jgi:CubicO group peptidase (beta-lactamase class C family)
LAYVKAMAERVFGPLGMTSSTADFERASRAPHAAPHALDLNGRPHELALGFEGNVVPIAPAGAVWSTLSDMEKYALAELSHGVAADGKRVVSEAQFAQRWQRRIGDAASGYGLGIHLEQAGGLSIVGHDGGADGFGTSLFLIPELELGLIVLTNIRNGTGEEQLPFNAAVKRKLLELSFEGATRDSEVIIQFALRMRADEVRRQSLGVEHAPDAEWVASISGHYSSPNLGRLIITPAAQGATFDVGEWQVTVGRRRHPDGSSELVTLDPPFAGASMPIGADGSIKLPDPQTDYVFTRDR